MNDYEEYLYDKKYERIRENIENKTIEVSDIKLVDDLFNCKTKRTMDIINELAELNKKGITSLQFTTYHDEKCFVDTKRIYGLAQEDDYYFSTYEISYHNPRYEIEAFYLDLVETLNKQYMWEKGFNNDNNIKSINE